MIRVKEIAVLLKNGLMRMFLVPGVVSGAMGRGVSGSYVGTRGA